MERADDLCSAVKLFGMSNQLLEQGLNKVEKVHKIDLGREKKSTGEKDERYYPQFDQHIRTEASRMAEHYEIFYCLEKTIRNLLCETLEAADPKIWWSPKRIPQVIFTETEKRMQRERESGITIRSESPLDYTNFGELGEIIKMNWDVFGSLFDNSRAVEKVLNNLNLLRAPIAHCSPLAEDEVVRLRLSVKDWFRLME